MAIQVEINDASVFHQSRKCLHFINITFQWMKSSIAFLAKQVVIFVCVCFFNLIYLFFSKFLNFYNTVLVLPHNSANWP